MFIIMVTYNGTNRETNKQKRGKNNMALTKEELKVKLEEMGYTDVQITELGFTATNQYKEPRTFRLDIRGNDKVPFYNIVAVDIPINGDDVTKPLEIKQLEKDADGNYLHITSILDLTVNKTPQEIEKLERLALR